MPAEFVDGHVKLDVGSLVGASSHRSVQAASIDEMIGAGICEGCSSLRCTTVDDKIAGISSTVEGRVSAPGPVVGVGHIHRSGAEDSGVEILGSDLEGGSTGGEQFDLCRLYDPAEAGLGRVWVVAVDTLEHGIEQVVGCNPCLAIDDGAGLDAVTLKTSVVNHLQRRLRCTMSSFCRDVMRVSGELRGRHRRHYLARQRHEPWNRCALSNLSVRQVSRWGSILEHIVGSPQAPHPLGEVRIQVAVKKAVTGSLVAVSTAGIIDLVGVAATRGNRLGIDVARVRVPRFQQPLMSVKVEHMSL